MDSLASANRIQPIVLFIIKASDRTGGKAASDSLRRQLKDLPGLEAALDGRQLDQLPAQEVFTLAKALPLALRSQMTTIYRGVERDMLDTGRLDQASALVQLAELSGMPWSSAPTTIWR